MADEISKTTIVVLLILTILISVIGTVTVISAVTNVGQGTGMSTSQQNSGKATISLNIQKPEPPATGQAVMSLTIAKK